MKKILLILGVLVVVAALASGVSIAYANNGNGNGNNNGNAVQQRTQLCDELLAGTIMQVTGNAAAGTITLLPRGESTTVNITVNSDTTYRVLLAPRQQVGFEDLAYGDWIAVCVNNGAARTVVLLEAPERPFHLSLEGNVTFASNGVISGNINGGGTFTISGVSGNITGAVGQPIELNIGKNSPPAWGLLQGLNMRNLGAEIGLWMKNHGWMMGR